MANTCVLLPRWTQTTGRQRATFGKSNANRFFSRRADFACAPHARTLTRSPPSHFSLFPLVILDEIATCARAARRAGRSGCCTRRQPAPSWSWCSSGLLWLWQWVDLGRQPPAALIARLTPVDCGNLDALDNIHAWVQMATMQTRRAIRDQREDSSRHGGRHGSNGSRYTVSLGVTAATVDRWRGQNGGRMGLWLCCCGLLWHVACDEASLRRILCVAMTCIDSIVTTAIFEMHFGSTKSRRAASTSTALSRATSCVGATTSHSACRARFGTSMTTSGAEQPASTDVCTPAAVLSDQLTSASLPAMPRRTHGRRRRHTCNKTGATSADVRPLMAWWQHVF